MTWHDITWHDMTYHHVGSKTGAQDWKLACWVKDWCPRLGTRQKKAAQQHIWGSDCIIDLASVHKSKIQKLKRQHHHPTSSGNNNNNNNYNYFNKRRQPCWSRIVFDADSATLIRTFGCWFRTLRCDADPTRWFLIRNFIGPWLP